MSDLIYNQCVLTLMNVVLTGKFTSNTLSDDELLDGYRKSSIKELYNRIKTSRCLAQQITKEKFDPFIKGVKCILPLFNNNDIIKMLKLSQDPEIFTSKNFKLVVDEDPYLAKLMYRKYVLNVDQPIDFEIYGPLYVEKLEGRHIISCLKTRNYNLLKTYIKYYRYDDLCVCFEDKEDLELIKCLNLLYSKNIEVYSYHEDTNRLLLKCPNYFESR